MKHSQLLILTLLLALRLAAADSPSGLIYAPDGDAIVITNGTRWNNRPLYCHERFSLVWSGEMPALQGEMGVMYFGFQRGDQRMLVQHFSQRILRYRGGAMQWEFTDPRFPGLNLAVTATTLADANGVTVRMRAQGAQPDDRAVWIFYPPNPEKRNPVQTAESAQGFEFARQPANPLTLVQGRLSASVSQWEQLAYDDREDLSKAAPLAGALKPGAGLVTFALLGNEPQFVAMATADNDAPGFARLVRRHEPLDPATIADPQKAFVTGYARVNDFAERVKVSTPDPYLNAAMPAAVAASAGIFVNPTFVHGGSNWRQQQPGWRTMGGAIYYGWPDQVLRAVDFWGKLQVSANGDKTNAVFSPNGCQQAGNSLFFGAGWIDCKQPPHYDFQTQFFDEAIRAWRATGDPALEKILKPMLELHLEHCLACFDPDGDGLYESYNNTWPSDSIWFNGGGTPEESAYVYFGERAAADMCRRAGDAAGAARHNAIAERIRSAVSQQLWMPTRGQFASYVEAGGHHRQMPDAWAYAQCIPIEAGLTAPEQAWQAMFYTKSSFERFRLPYGGEMRQTSNFLPGMWSVRELFGGDNYMMALAYFLAGQGDEGWQLLRGTMCESMYGDGVPKSGYSNERAEFNQVNRISPGGLSHPNCAIDFTDISSMFARAVVEGLFGYRPDYPNGVVKLEPSFPVAWQHASIRTPYLVLELQTNKYRVQLTKPAAMQLGIPVRAEKIRSVTANGQIVKFTVEPWAGYGMLRLKLPATSFAEVVIEAEGAAVQLPVLAEEKTDGTPGSHLELKKVFGSVPRYQFTEVHVADKPNTKVLSEVPAGARWQTVDMSGHFNSDVRGIFKQKYLSPRPATCSMRLGDDGWSAWTFHWWGIATPEIKLAKIGEPLTTAQGAQFAKIAADKNIAFTSLWDNWPKSVTVPVNASGDAVWLLVCGSTTPMQGKIVNAVLRFQYADGQDETLELTSPINFWSLCKFGRQDYDYKRDGFSLPKDLPPQVQLGENCRAMVYGWKLRAGAKLVSVSLETLSQDVVIGLIGLSVMNPH